LAPRGQIHASADLHPLFSNKIPTIGKMGRQ